MFKITRRIAVISTAVALTTGAGAVIATTASAAPNRGDGGYYYCTPVRPADSGMYCTPTDGPRSGGWLPWWFGNGGGQPQPPRVTTAPRTSVPPPVVAPTTTSRPQTTSRTRTSQPPMSSTSDPYAPPNTNDLPAP